MDFIEQLCKEMAKNPHIMSFSDIGKAVTTGAIAGKKTGQPGGVVIGASLGLSLEASKRVVAMVDDLGAKKRRLPHVRE